MNEVETLSLSLCEMLDSRVGLIAALNGLDRSITETRFALQNAKLRHKIAAVQGSITKLQTTLLQPK